MHYTKISMLALATFTAAFPWDYSRHLADLYPIKEFPTVTSTNRPRNHTINGGQYLSDHCDVPMHPHICPRKIREDAKDERYRREWRDVTWPPEEREHWPPKVRLDFENIVRPRLPPNITLPSPLLPTNDEWLKEELYKGAAALAKMEEAKPASQKRIELEKLKTAATSFILASRCLHLRECKIYRESNIDFKWWDLAHWAIWFGRNFMSGKPFTRWQGGVTDDSFKAKVYDPLKNEILELTAKEALVNLGKRLKVLGFPPEDVY